MNEFLILFILKIKSFNIYEIKKFIDVNFAPVLQISTGAIIPVLKKLEKNGYLKTEKTITSGGLRKSVYSILPDGEKYFEELLKAKIIASPQVLKREIEVLLTLLTHDVLTLEQQGLLVEKIKNAIDDNIKLLEKSIKNKIMNIEYNQIELNNMQEKKRYLDEFLQG